MDVLPTELCVRILSELPISEAGVCALIRCSLIGNSTLRAASLELALWKPHYKHRYVHSDHAKEAERCVIFKENWRQLYQERRRIDHEALVALKALEACSSEDRAEHARRVVIHGLDVWDVLSEEEHRPLPTLFQTDEDVEKVKGGSPLTNLSRKYWASELLRIIARSNAIDKWISMKKSVPGEENGRVSFEEAYAALSSFHGILPGEIMARIDSLNELCKEYLDEKGICYDPDLEEFNIKKLCNAVCSFMRSRSFSRAGQMSFYDFRNSVPHLFLTTSTRSLPISLVFIFVGILKRFGLEASPLNTPNCVTALVRDTLVNVTRMPWEQDATLGVVENSEELKRVFGAPYQASLTAQLLDRAARNITIAGAVEFGNDLDEPNYADRQGEVVFLWLQTKYLADVLFAVFPGEPIENRIKSIIPAAHPRLFPLDMKLIIQDKLLPHCTFHPQALVEKKDDTYTGEVPESAPVPEQLNDIFVGQIIQGMQCVIGWKKVSSGIQLMLMDHKTLLVTRTTSLTSLKSTTCTIEDIKSFLQQPLLGQFFEDAEFQEAAVGSGSGRGRFIMNKHLMSLYPSDDVRGAHWVRGVGVQ
ncbi:hypothetical protein ACEPAG_175 [Sanghuangporus baumii]